MKKKNHEQLVNQFLGEENHKPRTDTGARTTDWEPLLSTTALLLKIK